MYDQYFDWRPVTLSVHVALLSVLVVACLGLPLARALARSNFPGKGLIESAITMPMVLPPSVTGYGLLLIIGKNGPLGNLGIMFTWWAAVLASTVVAFPLMYQSASAAFKGVDENFEKAARTLGAGEIRIFFTVTFPLAAQGIAAGLVMSFARALGEFGATLMVAGNIPGQTQTIPLAIYFAVESGDHEVAGVLVAVITLFSFVVIYSVNGWSRRKSS